MRAAVNGLREGADGVGGDERQVAVKNDDRALGDAGGLERHARGVTGPQTLRLLDALDVLLACEMSPHLVGPVPHDNNNPPGPCLARGARDPGDERTVE